MLGLRWLPGFWLLAGTLFAADRPVEFNRDVRPILSDKCFACHGPDSARREAGLRLDRREQAVAALDSGEKAIAPGDIAASELWRRVTSTDPDEVMPPPSAKLGRLSPDEISTLKRWIESGAEYQAHWAFLPIVSPELPEAATDPAQAQLSPIDRIVSAGLKSRGLVLQPEADRRTLIRRVTFDLTGLPPTPEEVAAFVNDAHPAAYERVVDRLLASPRYGERMAADWLDVARYADSYGFQVDREREMWPWRDWVIEAFHQNLSWDQFVTWQLAGDLLPDATPQQILATAFNRLHQQESEGGSVEEEYRVTYVNDRVVTFGTAFLGLTLECCRCHDHKFDPISQREYYQLFAFFGNIDEAGLYSFFTPSTPTPALPLLDDQQRQQWTAAVAARTAAEQAARELRQTRAPAFQAWLTKAAELSADIPGELAHYDFETRNADGKFVSRVGAEITATSPAQNEVVPGRDGNAVRLTGDHPITTNLGNFNAYEPFTVSLWLQTPDVKDRAVVFHRSRAWTDAASRGYELLIEEGRLKWSLIHFWPGNAVSIRAVEPLPTKTWVQVTVTSDGSSQAGGLQIAVDGRTVETEIIRNRLTRSITGGGGDQIAIGERFRDRGFKGGLVDDLRVFNRALTPPEIQELFTPGRLATLLQTQPDKLSDRDRDDLFELYLARVDEAAREQREQLLASRRRTVELADSYREIMVMQELESPKPAYILQRGEYNLRGEAVTAGTPSALPPFPADQPRNRLGLARWLTDPQHPLLARVTVNRLWQSAFGIGLVTSAEDFGSQAERPEYPELLDWLSRDFIDQGWDLKQLWKTIVMSQTYRQQSFVAGTVMADDPNNRWLARGPRHRLPAEMIRDQVLAVSGLLVDKRGGPPVKTYDLSESFKPTPAGKGEQLYRRSVYTHWRRSGPGPVLEAFDVPNRQVCVVRRETTNTPLHAFVLLNGPQFVEAARVLAERLIAEQPNADVGLVVTAFEQLACRPPSADERRVLSTMYSQQLAWYAEHPEAAAAYIAIGDRPPQPELPAIKVAALAKVINALFSYDGCAVKR